MGFSIDRFETRPRDNGGRVSAGWRIRRYSFGTTVIQHLRTGRAHTGIVDCFGNVIYPENNIHSWRMQTEEIVPFYRDGMLPPHWKPGNPIR